jgi:dTDP-glucose 4,6-dehydratase
VSKLLKETKPSALINFAAESHVDRSIDAPETFINTNLLGVFEMLEAIRISQIHLQNDFRFIQISTDEVFGSISNGQFTEQTPYAPRSPYSASKAGGDHIARVYFHTYGIPTIITNCSNNYGPYQFPEKLVPLTILNALEDQPISVYGDGQNIRDWIHVNDHVNALMKIIRKGQTGETYLIGSNNCFPNLEIVQLLCRVLDSIHPKLGGGTYLDQIRFVKDRPGHDRRYAIDSSKIRTELNWSPTLNIEVGLRETVQWYLDMPNWWGPLRKNQYGGKRLGLIDNDINSNEPVKILTK